MGAILGVALLLNAWVFTFSLPWVLGILALIGGIAAIVAAFRLKKSVYILWLVNIVLAFLEDCTAEHRSTR